MSNGLTSSNYLVVVPWLDNPINLGGGGDGSEFRSLKFTEQTVMSENKIFSNAHGHQVRKIKCLRNKLHPTGGFTI